MTYLTPVTSAIAACLGLGLVSGCASKSVEVVDDNSPLIRTVIVTTSSSSSGFKGVLGRDGETVFHTMPNMRRINHSEKYTGNLLSRVTRKSDTSEIIRLDKGLEWQMDNRKKLYTECALEGCGKEATYALDTYAADTKKVEENVSAAREEDECEVNITRNDFNIVKTGAKRDVNGFPAEEYVMDWQLVMTDSEGASATNVVSSTTWNTPITGMVAEAVQMEETFDAAYRASLDISLPDQFSDVLPLEAVNALLDEVLADFDDQQVEDFKRLLAQLDAVSGYPVSQKMQWDARGETCVEPEEVVEKKESRLDVSSVSGFLKSVGKKVVKQEIAEQAEAKAEEINMAPILSIQTQVKSIEIGEIRESQLSVPANYTLNNRS